MYCVCFCMGGEERVVRVVRGANGDRYDIFAESRKALEESVGERARL